MLLIAERFAGDAVIPPQTLRAQPFAKPLLDGFLRRAEAASPG